MITAVAAAEVKQPSFSGFCCFRVDISHGDHKVETFWQPKVTLFTSHERTWLPLLELLLPEVATLLGLPVCCSLLLFYSERV